MRRDQRGFIAGRFLLRQAALHVGDFLLQFGHFVGLEIRRQAAMPFRQRFFPFRRGLIGLAALGQDIAQMAEHGRIVAIALTALRIYLSASANLFCL